MPIKENVVYSYTREQAIADGFFVDVTDMAKEAGFKWPVAITCGVHALCTPSEEAKGYGQDYQGRLWDVLSMARLAAKRAAEGEGLIIFKVIFQDGPRKKKIETLWAVCEGPAINIITPSEY